MPILRCLTSSHLLKHILSVSHFRNEGGFFCGDIHVLSCSLGRTQQTSFSQACVTKPSAVSRECDIDFRGSHMAKNQWLICCE